MNNKKAVSLLLCIVFCFTLCSFVSFAAPADKKGSITLTAVRKDNKEAVSGAGFKIYRFASADGTGEDVSFRYTEEFSKNGMDIVDLSDAYFPVHLASFAERKSVPYKEKVTDERGRAEFSSLAPGAYLIAPVTENDSKFRSSPFVVCIPMMDETKNEWVYNIDASPKIEVPEDVTEEKTYISVKKQWKTAEQIPSTVTVLLLKDGAFSDSVVLSRDNNWYYKWENLDKSHSWNVIEADAPEGYKVSYSTSQMTVIITNTDTDYKEETTTPEETTKPEELIDTGQLNWPVPVFAVAGLLIFSVGWVLFDSVKKEEEAV